MKWRFTSDQLTNSRLGLIHLNRHEPTRHLSASNFPENAPKLLSPSEAEEILQTDGYPWTLHHFLDSKKYSRHETGAIHAVVTNR